MRIPISCKYLVFHLSFYNVIQKKTSCISESPMLSGKNLGFDVMHVESLNITIEWIYFRVGRFSVKRESSKIFSFIFIAMLLSFFVFPAVNGSVEPNTVWSRTFGGTKWDGFTSLVATSDGGYAMAACTELFDAGDADCWLVKTDKVGNTVPEFPSFLIPPMFMVATLLVVIISKIRLSPHGFSRNRNGSNN